MAATKTATRQSRSRTTESKGNGSRPATRAASQEVAVTKEATKAAGEMAQVAKAAGEMARSFAEVAPRAAAVSTDFSSELNNIDFAKMIGGPLQAAVDAQVASALATVNFINSVGFSEGEDGKRELVMVDFSHKRKDVKADGTPLDKEVYVKVPLLAMLPIPSLRIDQVVVDFNAKLNSVESSGTSDELGVKGEFGLKYGPVNLKISASYQRKTSYNVEVKKEYSINVNVKAVQDEIPAGLEKILGMLAS